MKHIPKSPCGQSVFGNPRYAARVHNVTSKSVADPYSPPVCTTAAGRGGFSTYSRDRELRRTLKDIGTNRITEDVMFPMATCHQTGKSFSLRSASLEEEYGRAGMRYDNWRRVWVLQ
jgi:hypothetical protein